MTQKRLEQKKSFTHAYSIMMHKFRQMKIALTRAKKKTHRFTEIKH